MAEDLKEKKGNNKRLAATNFGCGCASVAVILVLVVFTILTVEKLSSNKNFTLSRDHAKECGQNMLTVNVALDSFAHDHEGKLPEKLTDLEQYLFDLSSIYCPMMLAKGKSAEYIYTKDQEVILTCREHGRGDMTLKKNGKINIENLTIKNLMRWRNDAEKR